ncbi:MAG: chemotaxis protein CheW [Acidobacteriia bacterium]|nr:chemotaxis protein CheW [Terriglobia bacterium]
MEEQQLQPEPVPVELPAEPLDLTEPNLIPLEDAAAAPVEGAQEGDAGQVYVEPEPEPSQYCIFRAGRERFCFSVLDVEEVVEWPRLARIPLAPSFLMGIFNLRGSIVPVVDIAFTEGRRPDLTPKHVVVASLKAEGDRDVVRIGIAADEVIGTCSTTEPLSLDDAPLEVPHCCGMLRHDDRLALALDLKKLTETFPVPVI